MWSTEIRRGFVSMPLTLLMQSTQLAIIEHLTKPGSGASISVQGNMSEAGSIGYWFVLELPDRLQVLVFLTCYHVVSSQDKELKNQIDRHGMYYGDTAGPAILRCPAALDFDATLKAVETTLQISNLLPSLMFQQITLHQARWTQFKITINNECFISLEKLLGSCNNDLPTCRAINSYL